MNGSDLAFVYKGQVSERHIESSDFEEFFARSERPVRFALSARFGFDMGREATAEAFAYAWEHWDRVSEMENSAGYTYRVGQRLGQRMSMRREPLAFSTPHLEQPMVEPKLAPALSKLSARQRTAVVLVHGLGWSHRETAEGRLLAYRPGDETAYLVPGVVGADYYGMAAD